MYESYIYLWREIKLASERYVQCEGLSVGPIERPQNSRCVSSGCVSPQLILPSHLHSPSKLHTIHDTTVNVVFLTITFPTPT